MKRSLSTLEVIIPKKKEHEGLRENLIQLTISNICPKCGARRAIRNWEGFSYDGSRRLVVDCWENECGHIDKYDEILLEGVA